MSRNMPRNPAQSTNKSKYFQWERVNANLLLSKFAEARKIQDGRCAFDAGDYHFWLPVLNSALRPTTPEAMRLRDGCIKISLSDPAISLKDTEAFLARCDQQFEVFSKRSKSRFILYSTITYSGPRRVQCIGEGASRIHWGPGRNGSLLRKIRASQKPFSFQKSTLGLPPDDDLTPILVHVSAFDAWDAFEQSNDCIDRFRGLLNLLINSSKSINIFARLSEPHAMNRFRRGPLHTLHKPGGALATETFWYEHRWLHK